MRSEKGITLTSLAIYVLIMLIVLSMLAIVTSYFKSNIDGQDR